MAADEIVQLEMVDGVATLRLNQPETRNAVSVAMIEALGRVVETLFDRDDLRLVVLCGAGEGFSAGADPRDLVRGTAGEIAAMSAAGTAVCRRLAALPALVLGALHGYAVGGGFLLTLYCDLRWAAPGTTLGFPPVTRQWLPPWGLARLAGWVGALRAQQLLLRGELISAEAAAALGLIDRIVPAAELAGGIEDLARGARASNRGMMVEARRFFAALTEEEEVGADRRSIAAFERLVARPEAREAIARLAERYRRAAGLAEDAE